MNARDKAIAFRIVELLAVLALLIGGVALLAQQTGETQLLPGLSNKLFFGIVGAITAIYVALAFSKFLFKNLPSAYEEKRDEPGVASGKALGKYEEIKYSEKKNAFDSGFDKYYTPLPRLRQK